MPAAGDDDHGLAHRQHAENGDAKADVEQVSAGEEHVAAQRAEDDDENGKRHQKADVVNAEALDDARGSAPGVGLRFRCAKLEAVH